MKKPSFATISLKTAAVHMVTYFLVGALLMFAFGFLKPVG